jgi:MscS family membrane protein
MLRFVALAGAGDFVEAARYLDVDPSEKDEGPELARRLKAVLDRHVDLTPGSFSALSGGTRADNLPGSTDEIGSIRSPDGKSEPVTIVRRYTGAGSPYWVFSRATVDRVDIWYGRLEHRWILEHLPAPLLRTGPGNLPWWQWLALPLLVVGIWIVAALLNRTTATALGRIATRTKTKWGDAIVKRLGGPLTLAWGLGLAYVVVPWLALNRAADTFARGFLRVLVFVDIFWALARLVDVAGQVIAQSRWARMRRASRSLIPLAARVAKVGLLGVALVALLSELGYPVASLIAGLGLGGLAFALAAQKTVENLFGAFSIAADQPFREGDFVRIDDSLGTVESIGLRSTKIRTIDRTVITMPNGKLAEMKVETFAPRDRIRLGFVLGLVYGTTAAQMREVLSGITRLLRDHPKTRADTVDVHFTGLGESAMNIEVSVYFDTDDWSEFQRIREDLLLEIMDVVERAKTSVAYPTRTLHVLPKDT